MLHLLRVNFLFEVNNGLILRLYNEVSISLCVCDIMPVCLEEEHRFCGI
jgi:hypothetical protein